MNEKMFVVPKPGLTVRDPITRQPLPAEGAEVPRDSYWIRRVTDGDVTEEGQAPKTNKAKEK
jgi:hypothetical protein